MPALFETTKVLHEILVYIFVYNEASPKCTEVGLKMLKVESLLLVEYEFPPPHIRRRQ